MSALKPKDENFVKPKDENFVRFLKIGELTSRLAISKSEAFRRIHTVPGFPQPIRMGARSVVYSSQELEAYMLACIAKRDARAAA